MSRLGYILNEVFCCSQGVSSSTTFLIKVWTPCISMHTNIRTTIYPLSTVNRVNNIVMFIFLHHLHRHELYAYLSIPKKKKNEML